MTRTGARFFDPTGSAVEQHKQIAPRVDSLDGKVIGILNNAKWNVWPLVDRIEQRLAERFQVKEFVRQTASFIRRADMAVLEDLKRRCDVVVNAIGD